MSNYHARPPILDVTSRHGALVSWSMMLIAAAIVGLACFGLVRVPPAGLFAGMVAGLLVLAAVDRKYQVRPGEVGGFPGSFEALTQAEKEVALRMAWLDSRPSVAKPKWIPIGFNVGSFLCVFFMILIVVAIVEHNVPEEYASMIWAVSAVTVAVVPATVQAAVTRETASEQFSELSRLFQAYADSMAETEFRRLAVVWVRASEAVWTERAVDLAARLCTSGLDMPPAATSTYPLVSRGGAYAPEDMPARELKIVVLGVADYLGMRKGFVADLEGTSARWALESEHTIAWREDDPAERELYFTDIVTVDFAPDTGAPGGGDQGVFVLKLVDGQALEYSAQKATGTSAVNVIRAKTRAAKTGRPLERSQ